MDKTKLVSNDLELPPLRSLDDFLLESARFQIPNIKDLEKWGNRVVNNLLYYQTNYLFMSVVIFLIVGLLHPVKMLVGMLAMMAILGVFAYVSMEGSMVHNFKKQYPVVGVLFIVFAGCFITYTLGSLVVFLLGILLPFCAIFIHASLRLRNIKNKIANKIEGIGLKRTPMGVFLGHLDKLEESLEIYIYHKYYRAFSLMDLLGNRIINQEKHISMLVRNYFKKDVTGMTLRAQTSLMQPPH